MTADSAARLAAFLAVNEPAVDLPGVTIRDAATMLVIDRTGSAPAVLIGRRHHGHTFMPGKFVFPGGRVEPADHLVRAATPLDRRVEARLMSRVRDAAATSRGFALAAIREVFEETGLILGTRAAGTTAGPILDEVEPSDGADEWTRFAQSGIVPDLGALHFIARAITPPGRSRRYDTRFFAVDADAIAARIEGVVGPDTELVELVWMPVDEAENHDMADITLAVLEELKIRTNEGFSHDLPVPFYRVHRGKRLRELIL